jgi:hypothetical protein
MRNLRMFQKLCGEQNFQNVVLGITWWDKEDPDVTAAREKVLIETPELWGEMVKKGSKVIRVPMDKDGCIRLLVGFAQGNSTTLQIQDEMFKKKKSALETSAATEMEHYDVIRAIRDNEALQRAAQQRVHQERLLRLEREKKEKAEQQKRSFENYQSKLRDQAAALARQKELNEKVERQRLERQRRKEEERERQRKELAKKQEELRQARLEIEKANAERIKKTKIEAVNRRYRSHSTSIKTQFDLINVYCSSGRARQDVSLPRASLSCSQTAVSTTINIFCDQCLVQLPIYDTFWSE